jgi:hypothetical protein
MDGECMQRGRQTEKLMVPFFGQNYQLCTCTWKKTCIKSPIHLIRSYKFT